MSAEIKEKSMVPKSDFSIYYSIIQAKNNSDGTRYKNCLSDKTAFMWNFQLERSCAGYCYDGFDSYGLNIPIQIRGQPNQNSTFNNHWFSEGSQNGQDVQNSRFFIDRLEDGTRCWLSN